MRGIPSAFLGAGAAAGAVVSAKAGGSATGGGGREVGAAPLALATGAAGGGGGGVGAAPLAWAGGSTLALPLPPMDAARVGGVPQVRAGSADLRAHTVNAIPCGASPPIPPPAPVSDTASPPSAHALGC